MAQGPLYGIRTLEFGSTIATPFCARLLADFGAEVVKIEVPEGDPVRTFGKRHRGKSLYASDSGHGPGESAVRPAPYRPGGVERP